MQSIETLLLELLKLLEITDLIIVLVALVLARITWHYLGQTKKNSRRILKKQIESIFIIGIFAVVGMGIHHMFFAQKSIFPNDKQGIIILRILGDDEHNSLQRKLQHSLNDKLQNVVDIYLSDKIVTESNGLKLAHEKARKIGYDSKAMLVVWGDCIKENEFYPRITVVNNELQDSINYNHTLLPQNISEFNLPAEIVRTPVTLSYFLLGYNYYVKKKYMIGLDHFRKALDFLSLDSLAPIEMKHILLFAGNSHAYLAGLESKFYVYTQHNQKNAHHLSEAISYYSKAIKIDSQYVQPLHSRGVIHSVKGDTSKALLDWNKAIKLDSSHVKALVNRGTYNTAFGDFTPALNDFNRALDIDSISVTALIGRGNLYSQMGLCEKGLVDINGAISLNPKLSPAFIIRGQLNHCLGSYTQALADWNEALLLDSIYAAVAIHVNRGVIYNIMELYDQALIEYNNALIIDSTEVSAYYNRGNTLRHMGHYDMAMKDYEKAIELNRSTSLAYMGRGLVYEAKGNLKKAIFNLNEAVKFNSKDSEIFVNRGVIYVKLSDPQRAILDFNKAAELDSNAILAYINRATAYKILEAYDLAVMDLNKANNIDPNDARVYFARANIFYLKHLYSQAFKDYDMAIKMDSTDYAYYAARGSLHRTVGEYKLAIADLNSSLNLDPENREVNISLMSIHREIGHPDLLKDWANRTKVGTAYIYGRFSWKSLINKELEKAVNFANKGLASDPEQTWIHIKLAHCYLLLGGIDEAQKIYLENKHMYELILEDFDAMAAKGIIHADINRIRALLNY